jgi:hypothetical protein
LLGRLGFRRAQEGYHALFLLAIGTGVHSILPDELRHGSIATAIWLLMFMSVLACVVFRWRRPVRLAASTALVFSPIVPLLVVQILTWSRFGTPAESRPRSSTSRDAKGPVLILLFDEWTFGRTLSDGKIPNSLPNLQELARSSFFFRNARSSGRTTAVSIPQFLLHSAGALEINRGRIIWRDGTQQIDPVRHRNLFDEAQQRGYRTWITGFYLPYRLILGNEVGYVRSPPYTPRGRSLGGKMVIAWEWNLKYYHDPISRRFADRLIRGRYTRRWRDMTYEIREEARELIRGSAGKVFGLVHWPVPHKPFIFDRRGFRSELPTVQGYVEQIQYADRLLGEVIELLKTTGLWEQATVILCSDHGWKEDPAPIEADQNWVYHVPLLVKWRGQHVQNIIDRPVSLRDVGLLVTSAFDGRPMSDAMQIIERLPIPSGPSVIQSPEPAAGLTPAGEERWSDEDLRRVAAVSVRNKVD